MLPIAMDPEAIERITAEAKAGREIEIDLPGQAVKAADGTPLGTFDVDERAIGVGVRLMARTALHALAADTAVPAGTPGSTAPATSSAPAPSRSRPRPSPRRIAGT